jgi:hypothetical protein
LPLFQNAGSQSKYSQKDAHNFSKLLNLAWGKITGQGKGNTCEGSRDHHVERFSILYIATAEPKVKLSYPNPPFLYVNFR